MQERDVVESILFAFPDEFDEHIERGSCPRPAYSHYRGVDMDGSHVVFDDTSDRKQPDWTYAPN